MFIIKSKNINTNKVTILEQYKTKAAAQKAFNRWSNHKNYITGELMYTLKNETTLVSMVDIIKLIEA